MTTSGKATPERGFERLVGGGDPALFNVQTQAAGPRGKTAVSNWGSFERLTSGGSARHELQSTPSHHAGGP